MFEIKSLRFKSILNIEHLVIDEGKITCITGPSGSGKTTLLRMLNKLISPDSGEISYKGEPISKMDSVLLRRKVLMLPQSPVIYNGNIRDNLLVGFRFSQSPYPPDEELKSALECIKLDKSLDESAQDLSGGEKQRLCLARIILMDGDVYLLDEPSSALDKGTEDFILENITEFTKKQSKTLVLITHSKNVADNYSDVIVEIDKGSILSITRRDTL